jgi:hypothetical protein
MVKEIKHDESVPNGAQDSGQICRDTFVRIWLTRQDPSPTYTTFRHISLAEVEDLRETVFVPLAETIFIHHNDPEEYRANVVALGYPELAETLDKRPRTSNTRKCNFGEILASEYLRQFEEYQIPIYRLRYNPNPESAMKGDDVLAFKFGEPDGSGREILIIESKVRGRFATEAVEEAYEQLESGHRPRPKSILFVVTMLRKDKRDDEADQVVRLLNKFSPNQPVRRNVIFLVTGNRPRDPFRYIQEREEVIENLIAADVCITNMDSFVNAVFDCEVEVDGT